jgi:hypothetical protein
MITTQHKTTGLSGAGRRWTPVLVAAVAAALMLSACGGGGGETDAPEGGDEPGQFVPDPGATPSASTQEDLGSVEIHDGIGSGGLSGSFQIPAGTLMAHYVVMVGADLMPEGMLNYTAKVGPSLEFSNLIQWESDGGYWEERRCLRYASPLSSAEEFPYSVVFDVNARGQYPGLASVYVAGAKVILETFPSTDTGGRCDGVEIEDR